MKKFIKFFNDRLTQSHYAMILWTCCITVITLRYDFWICDYIFMSGSNYGFEDIPIGLIPDIITVVFIRITYAGVVFWIFGMWYCWYHEKFLLFYWLKYIRIMTKHYIRRNPYLNYLFR